MTQAPHAIVFKVLQATVIVCAAVFVFVKWTHPSEQDQAEAVERQGADLKPGHFPFLVEVMRGQNTIDE